MTLISSLPKAPEAAAQARRAVEQLHGHLTPDQLETARLLVTEVVTNAVRHVDCDGDIALELDIDDRRIRFEVIDPGTGFVARARTPESPLDGSWGLHFLEVLSDGWGIDSGPGNTVWFELARATA